MGIAHRRLWCKATMESTRLSLVLLALLACHVSLAIQEQEQDSAMLSGEYAQQTQNGNAVDKVQNPDDKGLKGKEIEKLDKQITSFSQMMKMLDKTQEEETQKVMAKDDDADEEVAIGDTLKSMEAEHAVKDELASEQNVDCEMSEWGKFGKCSKLCDGGTKERQRSVQRQSQNQGTACEKLNEEQDCNTDSCASQTYQRRATRRKLTKREKQKEHNNNMRHIKQAKRSKTVAEMMKRTRRVMRLLVHTELAEVRIPGEPPATDDSQVRKVLKEAMAKNAVDNALDTVKQATSAQEVEEPPSHEEALIEQITKSKTGTQTPSV